MCLRVSYKKRIWREKFFFASLKSPKKRVGSGSISPRYGSAPKCHGSPTCVLMGDMQCAGCVSARWWCWAARTAGASCRRPTWTSTGRRTRGCAAATRYTSATRGILRMRGKQNIYFDLIEWTSELFWIEADIRMISFSRGEFVP